MVPNTCAYYFLPVAFSSSSRSQLNSPSKKILPNSQEKTWGGIAFLVMLLVDAILYRFFMGLYGGLVLALILSNSFCPLYFLFSELYPGLLQTYFTLFRWAFSGLVKDRGESRDTPLEFCWNQCFFTENQQILLYQEIQT